MLARGQIATLIIEKPAAGGRMIARVDGQIVLVASAIPGERVTARISRVAKGVAYADTISVEDRSDDRRPVAGDPACGGCLYAHIEYPRQLTIKGQVIADAFQRIGHIPLSIIPGVFPSPDEGYRMRARLHLPEGHSRSGFFREGTHEVCDARVTRQLLPATCDSIDRVVGALRSLDATGAYEIEVSENIDASQRVVHLDATASADRRRLSTLRLVEGVSGVTTATTLLDGDPYITDILTIENQSVALRRHVLAFFQGNRYLLRDLIAHVVAPIEQGGSVVDLYAGVGAFAIAAAVARGARVIAVEGDRAAASDLVQNTAATGGAVEALHQDVETFTGRSQSAPVTPDVLILDPPRTGLSKAALEGAIRLRARQIIYVSCDVATLARDSRKLLDAGYAIQAVDAFDLFPNTPHVETVVRFEDVRDVRM